MRDFVGLNGFFSEYIPPIPYKLEFIRRGGKIPNAKRVEQGLDKINIVFGIYGKHDPLIQRLQQIDYEITSHHFILSQPQSSQLDFLYSTLAKRPPPSRSQNRQDDLDSQTETEGNGGKKKEYIPSKLNIVTFPTQTDSSSTPTRSSLLGITSRSPTLSPPQNDLPSPSFSSSPFDPSLLQWTEPSLPTLHQNPNSNSDSEEPTMDDDSAFFEIDPLGGVKEGWNGSNFPEIKDVHPLLDFGETTDEREGKGLILIHLDKTPPPPSLSPLRIPPTGIPPLIPHHPLPLPTERQKISLRKLFQNCPVAPLEFPSTPTSSTRLREVRQKRGWRELEKGVTKGFEARKRIKVGG